MTENEMLPKKTAAPDLVQRRYSPRDPRTSRRFAIQCSASRLKLRPVALPYAFQKSNSAMTPDSMSCGEWRLIPGSREQLNPACVCPTAEGGVKGIRMSTVPKDILTERDEPKKRLQDSHDETLHLAWTGAIVAISSTLAHEINQPLTVIANYVQTCRNMLESGDAPNISSIREALARTEDEIFRAAEIVRRLRVLAGRSETRKIFEPVAELISESFQIGLAGVQSRGVIRQMDLAADLGVVFVDYMQMQHVLITLLHNAVEAMASNGRGEVRVASCKDGAFVRIVVSDTGPGLPDEIKGRLFQPFVSTKDGGMGLGLSVCRTIVEAHGGKIWYEDAPGGGSAFQFTVPRAHVSAGDG